MAFKDLIKRATDYFKTAGKNYVQGRIVEPYKRAKALEGKFKPGLNWETLDYGGSVLGSAFSMTPFGAAYAGAESAISSALKTSRERPKSRTFAERIIPTDLVSPDYWNQFGKNFQRNIGTFDSGVVTQGLGVGEGTTAGLIADIVVDPYSMGSALKALRKAPNLISKFSAKPESIKDILTKRAGKVGSTLKAPTGLPTSEVPAIPFNEKLVTKLFPDPKDRKLADNVHRAFSVQGKNTFDEVTAQASIAYYIKNLGRKNVQKAYDMHLNYPQSRSIDKFWRELEGMASNKQLTPPRKLIQADNLQPQPQSTVGGTNTNIDISLKQARKNNSVLKMKHEEAIKRIKAGDIEGAKSVVTSIYDQADAGDNMYPILRDIEARIGAASSTKPQSTVGSPDELLKLARNKGGSRTIEDVAKLKADIAKNGIKEPIVIVKDESGQFIGDGVHRLEIAKELGIKDVPYIIRDKSQSTVGGVIEGPTPVQKLQKETLSLEGRIMNEASEGYLDGLRKMAGDLGLDEQNYKKMLQSFVDQKYPELIGDYMAPAPKVTKTVTKVLKDQGKIVFDANQPLTPQVTRIKPTRENVPQIFEQARTALDQKHQKLVMELKAHGLTPEEFGRMWSESGSAKMPDNLKKAMNLQKEITDDLMGIAKTAVDPKKDYQFPRVWENNRQLTEIVPDTWVDVMNTRFLHHLPRTGKKGFIYDLTQANQDYLQRALSDRFADKIMEITHNMKPGEVKVRMQLQNKISNAIIKDEVGRVDTISILKGIHQKFHKGNKNIGKRIVDKTVGWLSWIFDTRISNLKKLGLYDIFEPLARYKAYAQNDFMKFDELLQTDKVADALKWVQAAFPEIDAGSLEVILFKYRQAKNPDQLFTARALFEKMFKKVYRQRGEKHLEEGLVTLTFTDKHMHANVNRIATQMLGQGLWAQDMASKVINALSRTFSSAMLGFKPKTVMYQIFEAKRLWADTDVPTTLKGFQRAAGEVKDGLPILKKYGLEKSFIEELIGQNSIGKSQNAITQAQDLSLKPMIQADRFKNAWFLHAYEMVADAKGLTGKAKLDYVMGKFENMAHAYTGLNIVEGFTHKYIRLLAQFSHYPIKEIRLIERKARSGDFKYLTKLAGINATIMYTLGKTLGLSFENIWGGTPGWGPAVSLVDDTFEYLEDMLVESKEEDPEYAKVTGEFAKDTSMDYFVPGGSQFNKMGETYKADVQGYAATPTDRVRYPMPESDIDRLKAYTLGMTSTPEYYEYSGVNPNIPYGVSRILNPYKQPLGDVQSEKYRTLNEVDPQRARQYYTNVQNEREDKSIEPTAATMGSASAFGEAGMGALTQERPASIYDMLSKNQELSDQRDLITAVMSGKEKGMAETTMQERIQYLQDLGVTQEDITKWEYWKAGNLPIKDKAELIMGMEQVDWVSLYQNEVISSLEVLKELEKRGFIRDASSLWEKLKMTDPYERRKAESKLSKDFQMDMAKSRAKTTKAMLKARHNTRVKSMKALLKKKGTTLKKPKIKTMGKIKTPQLKTYKPVSLAKLPEGKAPTDYFARL